MILTPNNPTPHALPPSTFDVFIVESVQEPLPGQIEGRDEEWGTVFYDLGEGILSGSDALTGERQMTKLHLHVAQEIDDLRECECHE